MSDKIILGTPYFPTVTAACRYFRDYGDDNATVRRKVEEGLIYIGEPPAVMGERVVTRKWLGDKGTRWHVETAPKPERITVFVRGRRWFQRSAGNTYHTVSVSLSDGRCWKSPITYGYGGQFLSTAGEWLETQLAGREKYPNGGAEPLSLWFKRVGVDYRYDVQDVARKRDL